ncbi:uncharacterized protein LOC135681755 [Rhopilema esculentum]|uniref:uncharacterized protein LOC135681755 n=1 Tax=Rhopilema esculentum TaxID=499914 RepID=UPI0031DA0489
MLSQFFILSSRGDTLVFRDYRRDIVKGSAEIFFQKLNASNKDEANPVFTVEGTHFIFVKKYGLYFVAATKTTNVSPTYVVELLNRIASICKDYCGVLNEESIRWNFTLIYEILDEVLDFGYPQITSTEQLKSFVFHDVHMVKDSEGASKQATGSNLFGSDKLTLPSNASNVSVHSTTKKGGRKNEVFIDVLERLTVLFAADGNLIRSEIDGCIQVKSFLAGNPEIRIGLNEDIVFGHPGAVAGSHRSIVFDDYSLHEKVDADMLEKNRQLNIDPPDGEFNAMSYRITGNFPKPLPFRLYPYIDEAEDGKSINVQLKLCCELPTSNSVANVIVRLPVPRSTLSTSHEVTTGSKTAQFKANEKCIIWGIKKMLGGREHFAKFKIILPGPGTSARQEIGPISVDFEIPMYVCSGLSIRYLKVNERNNLYTPMRWIRLITHCDSFVQRL